MIEKVLVAAAALSLAVTAADAASRHKRKTAHKHAPVAAVVGAPHTYHGPRPVWAAPQQCFTDEGYGRYWPCGAGPHTR